METKPIALAIVCDCKTDVDQECYTDHSPATEGEKIEPPTVLHGYLDSRTSEERAHDATIESVTTVSSPADTEGVQKVSNKLSDVLLLDYPNALNLRNAVHAELMDDISSLIKSAEERGRDTYYTKGFEDAMLTVKRRVSQREDEILDEIGFYNATILNEYQARHGLTDEIMVGILTDAMNKHFPIILTQNGGIYAVVRSVDDVVALMQ